MHSVGTVTASKSREDKYSMIDHGEQYSCVPLTSPRWLLPAPDLPHLSWLPEGNRFLRYHTLHSWDSNFVMRLTSCFSFVQPDIWMKCTLESLMLKWLLFRENRLLLYPTIFFSSLLVQTHTFKNKLQFTPVAQTCQRCIDCLIAHLTFNDSLWVSLPH